MPSIYTKDHIFVKLCQSFYTSPIMLWIKAFHVIAMVCWFAGLFYLPRLFVYHTLCKDTPGIERFKTMEWKLYYYISTPSMLLTAFFGFLMIHANYAYYTHLNWLHVKLILVFFLGCYHVYCGKCLHNFRGNINHYSDRFYRILNEIPVIFLILIIILTIVKPF